MICCIIKREGSRKRKSKDVEKNVQPFGEMGLGNLLFCVILSPRKRFIILIDEYFFDLK